MKLNEQIREHRKKAGLTQEQVANYLGVSAPAVNKWESGSTYPDITLLSPLARLLGIDLNTLFTFHADLSKEEVGRFCNEVGREAVTNGVQAGFAAATKKIQEYPNCALLRYSLALLLEGNLETAALASADREKYASQLLDWYEQAANGQDEETREAATYILANKYLAHGKMEEAQKLIELLPDKRSVDKEMLKINVLLKQKKNQEAAAMAERKIFGDIAVLQSYLIKLVDIDLVLNETDAAACVADCSQKLATVFGLWEYNRYVCPLQIAVAAKDIPRSMELIEAMLKAVLAPFKIPAIFRHLSDKPIGDDFRARIIASLLHQFETDQEYAFLCSDSGFQALISRYKEDFLLK